MTKYATQQQIIVALTEVGEVDLAGRPARTARRRWLAVHLPISRVRMVPKIGDPFVVEWYAPEITNSN